MENLIIETKNLTFSYSKKRVDIQNLNLSVEKGSIYGFLGPNGSGKTTTIRLLLGLLKMDKGEVNLFNTPLSQNRIKCLSKIGALIENPSLYAHLTAFENLKITANYRNQPFKKRIDEVLEIVKLSDAKNKKVGAFSLGMKQRLGLAISLLEMPELLILDEPTNGLDPKGIIEMRQLIKDLNQQYGITVFISSHLLSEVEKTCTHLGVIKNGAMLFQGSLNSFKNTHSKNIRLHLDTNNNKKALGILEKVVSNNETNEETGITVELEDKKEISLIIDVLRLHDIEIYQIVKKDNLEDLFLMLTDN